MSCYEISKDPAQPQRLELHLTVTLEQGDSWVCSSLLLQGWQGPLSVSLLKARNQKFRDVIIQETHPPLASQAAVCRARCEAQKNRNCPPLNCSQHPNTPQCLAEFSLLTWTALAYRFHSSLDASSQSQMGFIDSSGLGLQPCSHDYY